MYLWVCWVFVAVRGLSLVAASGGHSSSRCAGLSLSRPLLLRGAGSVVVAHGLSCSAACGIFPDQGSNPCPLHWQADSQPLRHQGSPRTIEFLQLEETSEVIHPHIAAKAGIAPMVSQAGGHLCLSTLKARKHTAPKAAQPALGQPELLERSSFHCLMLSACLPHPSRFTSTTKGPQPWC